jgi:hypothetical protein
MQRVTPSTHGSFRISAPILFNPEGISKAFETMQDEQAPRSRPALL